MPIEPLDVAKHARDRFTCGVAAVDLYFQAVARQAADRRVAQTYVLVPKPPRTEPCEVVAYYTLVPHAYRDNELDPTTARALKVKGLNTIPMVLLGQLGVSIAHQEKGVGAAVLREALRRALYVSLSGGGVAVITDPIDGKADAWYQKHGFKVLIRGESRLVIPMALVARYNPDIVQAFKAEARPVEIKFGTQNYTS